MCSQLSLLIGNGRAIILLANNAEHGSFSMRAATLSLMTFILAASLLSQPARAAGKWVIDRGHASITFKADHLGFSVAHGRFHTFDADILFDPEDLSATALTVTIDAASVDTAWPDRDHHIRSRDFLNVAQYPAITFVSTGVRKTGDTTADITGDLTMIGQTREVTFNATLNRLAPSPFNPSQMIAGFRVEGVIERAQWGMTFGGAAFAEIVPVRIDMEISPAP